MEFRTEIQSEKQRGISGSGEANETQATVTRIWLVFFLFSFFLFVLFSRAADEGRFSFFFFLPRGITSFRDAVEKPSREDEMRTMSAWFPGEAGRAMRVKFLRSWAHRCGKHGSSALGVRRKARKTALGKLLSSRMTHLESGKMFERCASRARVRRVLPGRRVMRKDS